MLRVFIGTDPRQPIAWNILSDSIVRHASKPVSITPLSLKTLPITRRGLTEFTFSRFLPPWLCGYEGRALFLDADMVVNGDVSELEALELTAPVHVMQDQARFEWASAMLFDCSKCKVLTPEYVDDARNALLDLKWSDSVGHLPREWNHCVGYAQPEKAKLYHFTKGIPIWRETRGNVEDAVFHEAYKHMLHSVSHDELMGNSVHVRKAS
jgi:hypothetical protein